MQIEICANGLESAQNAQLGGADRIELCIDLSVGGLTPPLELIETVLDTIEIPVHVLIRPRAGNFIYDALELQAIHRSIDHCRTLGCAGVVFGALTKEGDLDLDALKGMMDASAEMEFTFHRAIDVLHNPFDALETLIELGVTRVLSSGGMPTALAGLDRLIELKAQAQDHITIMPGGGLSSQNVLIFQESGFETVHLSAIPKAQSQSLFNNPVHGVSDLEEIKNVVRLLA